MKRVLVFQHVDVEHPGIFRDFLANDGHGYDVVELDAGDPIPPLDGYAALWVMGGPMDVWEVEAHPWLAAEQAAIREAVVDRALPFLGFCLGHQLLGAALGGTVGKAAAAEVGVMPVALTPEGAASPYLEGLPATFDVLQWHGAEVGTPPPGARVLASSPRCAVQAMSVGTRAFSMQFHVEITATTVADWNAIPAYGEALVRILGTAGAADLARDAEAAMPAFNTLAARVYTNWKRTTGFG